jgi:hypothetical protein
MKKALTLIVALALVALGSVSWAATHPDSSRGPQKGQPTPNPDSISLNSSRSNVYKVKVTHVSMTDKTFTVEFNFSAAKLEALPKVRDVIATTYAETTSGGALEATTIKSAPGGTNDAQTSENGTMSSFRVANHLKVVTGTVTQVDAKKKTFAVEVTFSGKNLKGTFPEVGKFYDITFTQPTAGGPLEATTIHGTKSNSSSY